MTAPEHLPTVNEAVKCAGLGTEIIIFTDLLREHPEPLCLLNGLATDHCNGLRRLHDLLYSPDDAVDLITLKLDIESVACLATTSGTTGLPKVAARSHKAMVLESVAIEDNNAQKPYQIRRLFCTPIFHAFSSAQMLIGSLRYGHLSYFMKRFDDTYPQKLEDFCITETVAPPAMILRLVQSDRYIQEKLNSLRLLWSGGAPLADELRCKALAMFDHDVRIVQVWGMTEGGWFTTFKYPEDDASGSVGRMIPGFEVKLNNERASLLTNGQTAGELVVRSEHLMTQYFGNQDATSSAFDDGWLKTGDIGYVKDGRVYLVDRLKELVKVNGWQVAPAEIEAALLTSSDVDDAAVIGVGHDVNEHPLAFVVPSNLNVDKKCIKQHLLGRLTRYKVASLEISFVTQIPKSVAGKMLKNELRRWHEEDERNRDCAKCEQPT